MQYLVFQLQGAMASWGEAAVGEYRGTQDLPTVSALAGLLCAALGLRRDQENDIQAVHRHYLPAVGVYACGPMLRDYHTAQVAPRSLLKGTRHATRKDELSFPRTDLSTILSTRDHMQEVRYRIAVQTEKEAPYPLDVLRRALLTPVFVPYLGRKSCPLDAPMAPCLVDADDVLSALSGYPYAAEGSTSLPFKLTWCDGMTPGVESSLTVRQRDRLIHRGAWQYGERTQHVAILPQEA
ncbi:type I-E CRISPR-associated protein Cas5/CasD [Pigmentiphaga sp. NML080357]|uniref:type I-E CRISPR-associated protein Cas5/CasD n=1 Tax=Pigmentiphaga sp. NML080357 TaxID=2008675 RepID=UPI000B420BA4|nr:type I-E CRISPR-associated protein Cas5/CasD [Pigmentiphaga sp. NML080357]OVZ59071.1 type I-E CRISPR-associated protein Cas5/CasD [Pigmentiphaga sp. NML080357]